MADYNISEGGKKDVQEETEVATKGKNDWVVMGKLHAERCGNDGETVAAANNARCAAACHWCADGR